jgi:hypothetical protein
MIFNFDKKEYDSEKLSDQGKVLFIKASKYSYKKQN